MKIFLSGKIRFSMLLVFAGIAALLTSTSALAQGPEKEFANHYEAFVQKTLEKVPDIPGVGIVVIKDDKPIFVKAYGLADKEAGTKANTDTLFYIASSTKSFTALAAALLDKEGKIKLTEPVTKYAAGIDLRNSLPEKVTVRDLLIHTSGLKNEALTFRLAFSGDSDPKDMSKVFGGATSFNEAMYGKYAYTNLGYNIYGVLLQNHLNKKWQDLLQERIFHPLGMKHTTAYISKAGAKKWTVAAPYYFAAGAGKVTRSPLSKTDNNMQSAGGIFASISDIGRWLNMNMNNGKLTGKQVIPADVVSAVHTGYTKTVRDTPPFSGEGEYGLGWQIGKYKSEKVIYHHGGFPGYRSHISFMPDKKIAVAVLVNDGTVGGLAADVLATYAYDRLLTGESAEADYAKQLQDLVDGYERLKQKAVAAFAERAKRPSQLSLPLEAYVGKYTSEHFGTAYITTNGKALTVSMGKIKVVATNYTEKESIRVEMVPGSGEVVRFIKDGDGKIVSLNLAGGTFLKAGS